MVAKNSKKEEGTKRAIISKAQQYMILAVLGASLFLGAAVAVVVKSISRISYNASVIAAEDQSIVAFSDTIKNIGICTKPSGSVYTDDELKKCDPDSINASSVPNTLRSNILEVLAGSKALESVANQSTNNCINPTTGKNYTFKELDAKYDSAETASELSAASDLIKTCSALRVIPEALPAYENEEALLASIDRIFRLSGTEPESLSPTEETGVANYGNNLYTISVRLGIEANAGTVNTFLDNVERSIRNFNINVASINWSSNNSIDFQANGTAFYMLPTELNISSKVIKAGGN